MPTGTLATVMSIGGSTIKNTPVSKTADGTVVREVALPVGQAGTLTTRTNDGEGVITLSTGHGIAATTIVDIYWAAGARYGVRIDSLSGTGDVALAFDDTPAATGDVLPVATTAVVVTPRVSINVAIDGDEVEMFGVHSTQRGQVSFYDVGDALIKQYELEIAESVESWHSSMTGTNPLTGNPITYARASNASSTTAATLTILALEDSTP
jgi:hypothetical protein